MDSKIPSSYQRIRDGVAGYYEHKRGLIAVWGKEAVQFLDGLITNDVKTLEDGGQMLAAFPNAQGRLLAVVRVLRQNARFLFETEASTHEKLFQNLFRFTFAGDFFVSDLSEGFRFTEVFNCKSPLPAPVLAFHSNTVTTLAIPIEEWTGFCGTIIDRDNVEISDELYEILRIESGIPKYGVDMDETTIVPELGLDGLISYNKGCYIGQEIIARIHFRGHVAKRLTGVVLSGSVDAGTELATSDGRNAGRITSMTWSPKLESYIALAYVRYDYLTAGTRLEANGKAAIVTDLPFVN